MPGSTMLGGTGLCCFAAMDVVRFNASRDNKPSIVLYIADAGTVVQVVVTYPRAPQPGQGSVQALTTPLGRFRFDYKYAAGDQMGVDVGGHEPWRADPLQLARIFVFGYGFTASPERGPLHVVSSSQSKVVYAVQHGRWTYRFTLVSAFPGLPGSVWRLVRVQRALRG